MKKEVVIAFSILVLALSFVSAQERDETIPRLVLCGETDGGNEPEVKGIVTAYDFESGKATHVREDTCLSVTELQEWVCERISVHFVRTPCEGTCQNGACAFDSGEPEPPTCTPQCSGRECGSNGCGGSCGSCSIGENCNSAGQCAITSNGEITMTVNAQKNTYNTNEDIDITNAQTASIGEIFLSPGVAPEEEILESESVLAAFDFDGYIVEFESEKSPLFVQKAQLEQEVLENEQFIQQTSIFNPRRWQVQLFGTTERNVNEKFMQIEREYLNEHNQIRSAIEEELFDNLDFAPGEDIIKHDYTGVYNGISINVDEETAKHIEQLPGVRGVFPNLEVQGHLMDAIPGIGADLAHDLGFTGKGVKIAILDTGVDYTHPMLGACTREQFKEGNCEKVPYGKNYFAIDEKDTKREGRANSFCNFFAGEQCRGIYPNMQCVNKKKQFCNFLDKDDPWDDNGHGTHVASIAGGSAFGGLIGVAPDATIYGYKVLSKIGSGSYANVIAAIDDAVAQKVDVIGMSLGVTCIFEMLYPQLCGPDDPQSRAVNNAVAAGVVVTISAGNSGPVPGTIGSPGTARDAITVGATWKKDYDMPQLGSPNPQQHDMAFFSSRGPATDVRENKLVKPDIVAPGAVLCAAQGASYQDPQTRDEFGLCNTENGNFAHAAGTSMSQPVAAGVVALVLEAHSDWTPQQVKAALKQSAIDLDYNPFDQGAGLLNPIGAIEFEEAPLEVDLYYKEVESYVINVIGTVQGENIKNYKLEQGKGINPSSWTTLAQGSGAIDEKLLADAFDAGAFNGDTNIHFRLSTTQQNGQTSTAHLIYYRPIGQKLATKKGMQWQPSTQGNNLAYANLDVEVISSTKAENHWDIHNYDFQTGQITPLSSFGVNTLPMARDGCVIWHVFRGGLTKKNTGSGCSVGEVSDRKLGLARGIEVSQEGLVLFYQENKKDGVNPYYLKLSGSGEQRLLFSTTTPAVKIGCDTSVDLRVGCNQPKMGIGGNWAVFSVGEQNPRAESETEFPPENPKGLYIYDIKQRTFTLIDPLRRFGKNGIHIRGDKLFAINFGNIFTPLSVKIYSLPDINLEKIVQIPEVTSAGIEIDATGTYIAFSTYSNIYVTNLETEETQHISSGHSMPGISPSRGFTGIKPTVSTTHVAWSSRIHGSSDIYYVELDNLPTDGGGGTTCGDNICEGDETFRTCPADCDKETPTQPQPARCGNNRCEAGEDSNNCLQDCPTNGPTCGDGICEAPENSNTCPADCDEETPEPPQPPTNTDASVITNSKGQSVSGQLLMSLQRQSGSSWITERTIVNELVTVSANSEFDLSNVWNPNFVSSALTGNKRIYSSYTPTSGEVIAADELTVITEEDGEECTPNCDELDQCGNDGCGGTCGTCPQGSTCTERFFYKLCFPDSYQD
jgi:subtilisin family serine protease